MAAPVGNEFWKLVAQEGRPPLYDDPVDLLEAARGYFEWVTENPLKEEKIFAPSIHSGGEVTRTEIAKMRAMTIGGLCIHIGMTDETWRQYRGKEEFSGIVAYIDQVIRTQKLEGAAADLLNANIIARDLGLKDARELSGPGGGPVEIDYAESARAHLRGKLIPEKDGE